MSGKIIVLDGLDGSGKTTQAKLLYEYLKQKNEKVKLISFPDYSQSSSALVKMYLNGELSQNVEDINAYAASSFYAVDRYASFKKFWEKDYLDGYTIIATRYVTSNSIHQMSKLEQKQWDGYLNWLDDFEYEKLGLPRPDLVLFLNMSRKVADKLILDRYNGDNSKKDLHEKDMCYLEKCQTSALYVSKKQNWEVINCCNGESPLSVEDIRKNILKNIEKVI